MAPSSAQPAHRPQSERGGEGEQILERADGIYRVVAKAPARARIEVQEIPAWEAVWLPGFLAGD